MLHRLKGDGRLCLRVCLLCVLYIDPHESLSIYIQSSPGFDDGSPSLHNLHLLRDIGNFLTSTSVLGHLYIYDDDILACLHFIASNSTATVLVMNKTWVGLSWKPGCRLTCCTALWTHPQISPRIHAAIWMCSSSSTAPPHFNRESR